MNKKLMILAVLAVLTISTSAIAGASGDFAPPWMHKADEQVEQMIQEKKAIMNAETPPPSEDVYDAYLKKASKQEQKDKLRALQKDKSLGIGEWKRDALQVIGELPKDARRIKLEDAQRIHKQFKDEKSIIEAFNSIAGAPDFEGGSGIPRTIYFTDDTHKDAFYVIFNSVKHVVLDEKGNQTTKALDSDDTLVEPQPTVSPATAK